MTEPKTAQQLAEEHWNFVEGILLESMRTTMLLAKEFMIHGYKHGQDDLEAKLSSTGYVLQKGGTNEGVRIKSTEK